MHANWEIIALHTYPCIFRFQRCLNSAASTAVNSQTTGPGSTWDLLVLIRRRRMLFVHSVSQIVHAAHRLVHRFQVVNFCTFS
jgi:hypothetical protein